MNAIEFASQTNNLSFILLLISFSIIGILYAFHYKYSKELILSVFSQRNANQYLRDENVFKRRVNIFFNTLITLNIPIFICVAIFNQQLKIHLFLNILFFTCIYYIFKYICIWFIGVLLKMKQIINTALFFTTLFDKVFSLFCFPLLLLFHFFYFEIKELTIFLMLVVFFLFFILKIYWNLKVGIKSFGLSRFYLFIYICIIEFFPLLLVYRGIVFA